MKQMVILSGKGGTGKTTVAAGLAHLASAERRLMLADADVDAANLELVLSPNLLETHEFVSGELAAIDATACIGCGRCAEACRFGAVLPDPGQGSENGHLYRIDAGACEGCAACYYVCPEAAIVLSDRHSGRWFASETRFGPLLHAHLFAGQENSGKLVTLLRQETLARGTKGKADLAIVDGPPGIGCAATAAIADVDAVMVVTEPTPAGRHDLQRILELIGYFGIPAAVVLNKADLDAENAQAIREDCRLLPVPVIAEIPFDATVTRAITAGRPLVEYDNGPASQAVRSAWEAVQRLVEDIPPARLCETLSR